MLTVSNALFMSSVTVIVRSGGLFSLKPIAMVLSMYNNSYHHRSVIKQFYPLFHALFPYIIERH